MADVPQVEEIKVTSSPLLAAAKHLGEYCDTPNRAYMQCRFDKKNPELCLEEGRYVTECTAEFFKVLRGNCNERFTELWQCLDKNNQDFRFCSAAQKALAACAKEKMSFLGH
ncbi:NADH dehydrogenase 1 alpha subcomplex subunit 8 [Capsaspora owczarzaki ATCC 30864]|uniref:NADH dehydrogenase 1 alpha subcomplex subunit 8 n=1 Tax=Capsaspora owczarzaki (strain ATCC 30864) TaxID=595528 RepID=A0A0D2WUH2_CAPO3|nr:NADH dehydrogenase 1 alpha subcomplex subunit 8 [Capsaspora owczarzaki ATCC 30864]KJE96335.1 NADH dehydrogenase 1 alpha subcomplex subunit 8 [Capsaspora owczarzaki ATCC 30864]|eukprot:XP_004344297.1 NADH dehydrogenase 1 alpha subcomplex subunit 8 [Capsaspora owczarzaki ATCC 30864]